MDKILTAVLIGAGNRGKKYTDVMARIPDKYKVIAVAEPLESRRNIIQRTHNIPDEMCFTDWTDLFALGKIADIAVISTMDQQHFDPTMAAISLKYDILLEKPVSPDPVECEKLARHAKKEGV